jgi:Methyltransferase domain
MQELDEARLRELAGAAADRMELWTTFASAFGVATMAEVGVYRGDFAARMLGGVPGLERYYMVDPWRHLDDWNKPANQPDDVFDGFLAETMAKTEAQADKRVVLRGRTTEVVDRIPDDSLDLVYVDGDHTLRGITIDLLRLFPKVKEGGFVAGDDFCRNIFQHESGYEPTLVFPWAVYFAEAVGARIYALPHKQFVMQKVPVGEHAFVDLAGGYDRATLEAQITARDQRAAKQRRRERQQRQARRPAAPSAPAPRPSAPATVERVARGVARRVRSGLRRRGVTS